MSVISTTPRHMPWKKILAGVIRGLCIVFLCLCSLFPIFWAACTSFKVAADINAMPPKWIFQPTLEHWKTVFFEWNLPVFLKSSIIVSVLATFTTILIGTMAAYALARYTFRAKRALAMEILSIRMVPPIVTVVAMFIVSRKVGLYDTYPLLIALYTMFNLPLVVWVMKAFIEDIPVEVEEAARVDGCNPYQIFTWITLPLATPGLACCAILVFIACWNEFLFANILMAGDHRTLSLVAAMGLKHRVVLWGPSSATVMIMIVPILVLSFLVQRWIVRGISLGMVK